MQVKHIEQTKATAASLSKDLGCGTVSQNFVHQTSCWRRSETDLRHSCSICNCYPAHLQLFPILRYINVLNNISNNNNDVSASLQAAAVRVSLAVPTSILPTVTANYQLRWVVAPMAGASREDLNAATESAVPTS